MAEERPYEGYLRASIMIIEVVWAMSSRATSDPNPRLLDRRHVGAGTRASRGLQYLLYALRQNAAKVIHRAGCRIRPGSLACDLVTFV